MKVCIEFDTSQTEQDFPVLKAVLQFLGGGMSIEKKPQNTVEGLAAGGSPSKPPLTKTEAAPSKPAAPTKPAATQTKPAAPKAAPAAPAPSAAQPPPTAPSQPASEEIPDEEMREVFANMAREIDPQTTTAFLNELGYRRSASIPQGERAGVRDKVAERIAAIKAQNEAGGESGEDEESFE